MGRRAEASPGPNAILGASTPHSSTQTLIELALFTNSEQSRQGLPGPPPSQVLQPPVWGREVSGSQGTRWEPGTHQQEQHIAGDGHVEWLELVDGCKGCYFHQGVGVPVGVGGSPVSETPGGASSAPSPASSEDLRPRAPSAPALAPPRLARAAAGWGEARGTGAYLTWRSRDCPARSTAPAPGSCFPPSSPGAWPLRGAGKEKR